MSSLALAKVGHVWVQSNNKCVTCRTEVWPGYTIICMWNSVIGVALTASSVLWNRECGLCDSPPWQWYFDTKVEQNMSVIIVGLKEHCLRIILRTWWVLGTKLKNNRGKYRMGWQSSVKTIIWWLWLKFKVVALWTKAKSLKPSQSIKSFNADHHNRTLVSHMPGLFSIWSYSSLNLADSSTTMSSLTKL